MSNDRSFLGHYFLLLPHDIIVEIILLTPSGLTYFLLHSETLKPILKQLLDHHIITCEKNGKMTMGFKVNKPYIPFITNKPEFAFTMPSIFPFNEKIRQYFPYKIFHIEGHINQLKRYGYFKMKRLRVSVCIEFGSPLQAKSLECFYAPGLEYFEIYIYSKSKFLALTFIIKTESHLASLKEFGESLGKIEDWKKLFKRIPKYVPCQSMKCGIIKNEAYIDKYIDSELSTNKILSHLNRCALRTFHNNDFGTLGYIPEALLIFSFEGSKFNISPNFNWPPALHYISIYNSSMDDKTLSRLSSWPSHLQSLLLVNNRFSKFSSILNLSTNLDILCIAAGVIESEDSDNIKFGANSLIRFDVKNFASCLDCLFPDSLSALFLDGISFNDDLNYIIKLPSKLRDLALSRSVISLSQFIFPRSLTNIDLTDNKLVSLSDYDNIMLDKSWQQLTNLKELILGRNKLSSDALKNWLPPINLQVLELNSNQIDNLDIPIFKERMKQQTCNLRKINLAQCKIVEIPVDFYLPENLCSLDLTGNPLKSIPMQGPISHDTSYVSIIIGNSIIKVYK
ncbi:hypothetical protein DFJ63DRAFT_311504 [Scheffersomyces coipomensis]|uniref:uncharacterized protein n=1 Tax=Scheffersomyces coipomensis TaxID=1788519 RepID=UPI00315D6B30